MQSCAKLRRILPWRQHSYLKLPAFCLLARLRTKMRATLSLVVAQMDSPTISYTLYVYNTMVLKGRQSLSVCLLLVTSFLLQRQGYLSSAGVPFWSALWRVSWAECIGYIRNEHKLPKQVLKECK